VRDGSFPSLVAGGPHALPSIFGETAGDRSLIIRYSTLNNSPVFALDFMLLKKFLKLHLDCFSLCKNQQAARQFIQAMNYKELRFPVSFSNVVADVGVDRPLAFMGRGDGEQTGGFLDDQQILVFVKNMQAMNTFSAGRNSGYFDDISSAGLVACNLAHPTIQTNAFMPNYLAQGSIGRARQQRSKGVQ
jgi:hypothetical protein